MQHSLIERLSLKTNSERRMFDLIFIGHVWYNTDNDGDNDDADDNVGDRDDEYNGIGKDKINAYIHVHVLKEPEYENVNLTFVVNSWYEERYNKLSWS